MPIKKYVQILVFFLTIALFLERYFFIIAVYKTVNYGYVLVLCVIFLNTLFLFLIQKLRAHKEKKSLAQMLQSDKRPHVSKIVIIIIALLDMFKSFFFFWSANVV